MHRRGVVGGSEAFRTTSAPRRWSLKIFLRTTIESLPSNILITSNDGFNRHFPPYPGIIGKISRRGCMTSRA
jgi:hypothetical protein